MTIRTCKSCDGKGSLLWVYPNRKAIPVYWFQRGPKQEKPSTCDQCDGTGEVKE